jgi:hypothetical protein
MPGATERQGKQKNGDGKLSMVINCSDHTIWKFARAVIIAALFYRFSSFSDCLCSFLFSTLFSCPSLLRFMCVSLSPCLFPCPFYHSLSTGNALSATSQHVAENFFLTANRTVSHAFLKPQRECSRDSLPHMYVCAATSYCCDVHRCAHA